MNMKNENKKDLFGICPYVTTQRLLMGKGSFLIIHYLSKGPLRFNELQRKISCMTQATLSKQLKCLCDAGLVLRKEYPQIPPKVEYSLSDIGKDFEPVLKQIGIWGKEYIKFMHENNIMQD